MWRKPRKERLAAIERLAEEMCKEGRLVRVLDDQGKPERSGGLQVWRAMEKATPAERAFWERENLN